MMQHASAKTVENRTGVLRHHKFPVPQEDFQSDVLSGLARTQKTTPAKYLYDAQGSELFEQICDVPEYYPTRTELAILDGAMSRIATLAGPAPRLIELGSGASVKTRMLIEACRPQLYVPIDISEAALVDARERLSAEFPWLDITSVCADFTRPLKLPPTTTNGRTVIFFPGSTIGNFPPADAQNFLHLVRSLLPPGGILVIGVDLEKDKAVLDAAYNDARGVTAAFNLNLLTRINRELGGDFAVDQFRHDAFYNVDAHRIEMHLRSQREQRVTIAGQAFDFAAGETILTEISCKYSVERFQSMARSAGFLPEVVWTGPSNLFSVHALVAH